MASTQILVNKRLQLTEVTPLSTMSKTFSSLSIRSESRVKTPAQPRFVNKRFSTSRDDYFTTNASGAVVPVENPQKQFKVYPRSPIMQERRAAKESCDVRDECPRQFVKVETSSDKSFPAIPPLSGEIELLKTTLTQVRFTETSSEMKKIPLIAYVRGRWLSREHHRESDVLFAPFDTNEQTINKVKNYDVHINLFHANHWMEWLRVKELFVQLIKAFQMEALLEVDSTKYSRSFNNTSDYTHVDDLFSYTLQSLIHFTLFKTRAEEASFFKKLSKSTQKTKLVLDFVSKFTTQKIQESQWGVVEAGLVKVHQKLTHELSHKYSYNKLNMKHTWIVRNYVDGTELLKPQFAINYSQDLYARSIKTWVKESKHMQYFKDYVQRMESDSTGFKDEQYFEYKRMVDEYENRKDYLNAGDRVFK